MGAAEIIQVFLSTESDVSQRKGTTTRLHRGQSNLGSTRHGLTEGGNGLRVALAHTTIQGKAKLLQGNNNGSDHKRFPAGKTLTSTPRVPTVPSEGNITVLLLRLQLVRAFEEFLGAFGDVTRELSSREVILEGLIDVLQAVVKVFISITHLVHPIRTFSPNRRRVGPVVRYQGRIHGGGRHMCGRHWGGGNKTGFRSMNGLGGGGTGFGFGEKVILLLGGLVGLGLLLFKGLSENKGFLESGIMGHLGILLFLAEGVVIGEREEVVVVFIGSVEGRGFTEMGIGGVMCFGLVVMKERARFKEGRRLFMERSCFPMEKGW